MHAAHVYLMLYPARVKLYRFDAADESLELIPLAARRALDHGGQKLSLQGWKSLPIMVRQQLVELGSSPDISPAEVEALIILADPQPQPTDPIRDASPKEAPGSLIDLLGSKRSLPGATWSALSALDRYALLKVARRGDTERLADAYDEIVGHSASSTHLSADGGVRMVDVSAKPPTRRVAVAESEVKMNPDAFERLTRNDVPKGNVFATARVAGILAAKRTSELIPLCHPIPLNKIEVELEPEADSLSVRIITHVETLGRTGVEMEALVAASAAALTVYDMLKAFDRAMEVGPTRLLSKSGGRSKDYRR